MFRSLILAAALLVGTAPLVASAGEI
ncbi:DUF2502 domain-containing protein, partial [Cronobacter muytjensii]